MSRRQRCFAIPRWRQPLTKRPLPDTRPKTTGSVRAPWRFNYFAVSKIVESLLRRAGLEGTALRGWRLTKAERTPAKHPTGAPDPVPLGTRRLGFSRNYSRKLRPEKQVPDTCSTFSHLTTSRDLRSRESPPPRAARGAARHAKAGFFSAKLRWRRPEKRLCPTVIVRAPAKSCSNACPAFKRFRSLGVARGVFAELCDANPAKAPVGPPRRRAHRASYYPVGREKQNGQKQPQQNARWACRAHPDGREHPTTTAFLHCTRTKKAFGKRVSRKPFKLNRHRPLPHLNTPYAAP